MQEVGDERIAVLSVIAPEDLRHTLEAFFDEAAFLSPYGLRAVSKRYENNPYTLEGVEGAWIDYEPAESTTSMFGGNSNWRGPIWMPLNYLAIRQFAIYQRFFGDDFKVEYPTGSGEQRTFGEIAQDLADRIIAIWLPGPRRPPPALRRHRAAAERPGLEGQPVLQRVLPWRQRRRPGSGAPDRLDRAHGHGAIRTSPRRATTTVYC